MRRSRSLLLLLCCLLAAAQMQAARRSALSKRIEAVLSRPDLQRGFWGIEVVSLENGRVLYSLNSDKLFTPASNTKLFTTSAAMALIGGQYTSRTTVETRGALDANGRLHGNVALVGRGDANLSGRELPYNLRTERTGDPTAILEDLAEQVVKAGVKSVDGDVVADDSYFAFERYGQGWSQDDLVWGDGAPVSALTVNDNVEFVNILPANRAGEPALVTLKPAVDYFRVDNRILTTPPGTGRRIFINREPGSTVLTLWGNMPVGDDGADEALAIEDPAEFAAKIFRHLLEARGVVVSGQSVTRHTDLASLSTFSVTASAPMHGGEEPLQLPPPQPLVLASHESQPLIDDLTVINKVSQNLHAEILLRLLGRERGTWGTSEGGLEVLRGFLTQAGISPNEYAFYDGSGLSRQNLVTPHAIVKLLEYIHTQPWGENFRSTLPVGGVDGTLFDRFRDPRLHGRVDAKTGSLDGVKSLSGYAQTDRGEKVAFSILTNNFNLPGRDVVEAIDGVVRAIVEDGPLRGK